MTADPEQLSRWVADNPEAAAALRAEGAASERQRLQSEHSQQLKEAVAAGRLEGAQAEAKRQAEVRAQAIPGHEALVERLANDGQTTGPQAAVLILAAVREERAAAATARDAAIVPPLAHVAAPDDASAGPAPAFIQSASDEDALDKAVRSYQLANPGTSYLDALTAITRGN